ncbi:hypothetical protein OWR29_04415 [Actinoplanes sp. Pm04-4]|uniref:Lipoprotein n=1 Tax=Paractinoplanes pyxinae TaxID=2997416 RepID=A0ABT4ATT5_9ACTN|nr:hypothetical protein [Actinoplanes pyxinae]MCY1137232.1 hypothetical protein [Actinoplanes pyxinae]
MIRMRVVPAVLIGVSLMAALTACGGDETTAASAPAATTAAAPAPTTAAADPAASAADDKKLCAEAEKAGKEMKAELIKTLQAAEGEPDAAAMGKVLVGLADDLNQAAASSDSKVGQALKAFAAASDEAGKAANPETAADNPAYEQAGKDVRAACKEVGVAVNY